MLIMDRNQNKIYAWTKHRIHGMIVYDGRTCNSYTVEDKKFLRERMFNMTNLELKKHANDVRKGIIEGVHSAKAGHPGGSLSAADVFTFLYFEQMNIDPANPEMENRTVLYYPRVTLHPVCMRPSPIEDSSLWRI